MTLPTDVPADATPAPCPYCDRTFPEEEYLVLHKGLDHEAACSEAELADFESVYEAESEDLRLFQLKAVGLLVLLYFGLLITYAVAT